MPTETLLVVQAGVATGMTVRVNRPISSRMLITASAVMKITPSGYMYSMEKRVARLAPGA